MTGVSQAPSIERAGDRGTYLGSEHRVDRARAEPNKATGRPNHRWWICNNEFTKSFNKNNNTRSQIHRYKSTGLKTTKSGQLFLTDYRAEKRQSPVSFSSRTTGLKTTKSGQLYLTEQIHRAPTKRWAGAVSTEEILPVGSPVGGNGRCGGRARYPPKRSYR